MEGKTKSLVPYCYWLGQRWLQNHRNKGQWAVTSA